MDDGGRTLIDWLVPEVPVATAEPILAQARQPEWTFAEPPPGLQSFPELPIKTGARPPARSHIFDVGQPVSYSEDRKPEAWRGGYEIVKLHRTGTREPQYAIRNADQSYDRIVREHELREDLGSRGRGR
jgi:hypothetical protein